MWDLLHSAKKAVTKAFESISPAFGKRKRAEDDTHPAGARKHQATGSIAHTRVQDVGGSPDPYSHRLPFSSQVCSSALLESGWATRLDRFRFGAAYFPLPDAACRPRQPPRGASSAQSLPGCPGPGASIAAGRIYSRGPSLSRRGSGPGAGGCPAAWRGRRQHPHPPLPARLTGGHREVRGTRRSLRESRLSRRLTRSPLLQPRGGPPANQDQPGGRDLGPAAAGRGTV